MYSTFMKTFIRYFFINFFWPTNEITNSSYFISSTKCCQQVFGSDIMSQWSAYDVIAHFLNSNFFMNSEPSVKTTDFFTLFCRSTLEMIENYNELKTNVS